MLGESLMNKILEKIFEKYFRAKIKKDWSTNIVKENFNKKQEDHLIEQICEAVNAEIESVISNVKTSLDDSYWLIDTTIDDTIRTIKDEIEEAEKLKEEEENAENAENAEIEEPWITDDNLEGEIVICSYSNRDKCSCTHNIPHSFESPECLHECTYSNTDEKHSTACCGIINEEESDPNS